MFGRLSLRPELQRMEPEVCREAQKRAAARREWRAAADVVARIAGERGVVHREREPADSERVEGGADQIALGDHAGASHTTPSGGSVISAEAGWPSYGTGSARTVP